MNISMPNSKESIHLTQKIIFSAVHQHRRESYHFSHHIHSTIEIYLITKGQCQMDIANEKLFCEPGDFIIILPNTVHSFYVSGQESCEFDHIHFKPEPFYEITIDCDPTRALDLIHALLLYCSFYHKQSADETIQLYVSAILSKASLENPLAMAHINLDLTHLILYIIEQQVQSSHCHKGGFQNLYVARALEYIKEHYGEKILLTDIAQYLNISERYLTRIFRQYTNLTVSSYINIYRINQAIVMMTNTDQSLTEIALLIGLKNSQYFTRLFCQIIGITPSRYRRLIRAER